MTYLPGSDTQGHITIAGPCSAESPQQLLDTARALKAGGVGVLRAGVWKPRTMPGSFEGFGDEALSWLAAAKEATGMLTATEVATPAHVEAAIASGIDILWIGARTSANPFAVQEIADTIAALNPATGVIVKNPISPDLDLWIGAIQRILRAGINSVAAAHRGFSAYGESVYRNRPYWAIPIELRRRLPHIQLICDPSHIAGRRDLVPKVARQAIDMNFDGLIVETHPDPDHALSDAAQQLTPAELIAMLGTIATSQAEDLGSETLETLRRSIDETDDELVDVLRRRMDIARRIGQYKRAHGMTIVQPQRYHQLIESRIAAASAAGLDPEFMRRLYSLVHEESVRAQLHE